MTILCRTLRQAWTVPKRAVAAAGKAEQLGRMIRQLSGKHGAERVAARALQFADRRSACDRCVVVHGDPHPGNALRVPAPRPGAESGFWEWGYLERVSTGLYLLDLGADDHARPFLTTAERLIAS